MRHASILLAALAAPLLALAAAPALAADRWSDQDFRAAVEAGRAEGILDGTVTFHLHGAATPPVAERKGAARSSRRTNGVGKSDEAACERALLSVLVAMQAQAKERGANAVIGLVSMTKNVEAANAATYRCASGGIMSAVALRGEYARVRR